MSAGDQIELAQKRAAQAAGVLVYMVGRRRISREALEAALKLLEDACDAIKAVLTAHGGGHTVRELTQRKPGDDNGTTDAGG